MSARDRDIVFGMLLNSINAKTAVSKASVIAMKDSEWALLFGKFSSVVRDGGFVSLLAEKTLSECSNTLERALRCSLIEAKSKLSWQRSFTKAACYLALHAEDTEVLISECLGGIVRADSRRLDDFRSSIEDGDIDHMLISKVTIALARSVV
tara:strand:+ start:984 stop:1439 length:456 start_codon:yes stop_codon:yes gene_type:complete